jgi:hypothetical protein
MSPPLSASVLASLVLGSALPGPGSARVPHEPLLVPGPFAVGFRSTWTLDEGRTYCTAFDQGKTYGAAKSPRPLLVLLWYPADSSAAGAERMPHGGYFSIASEEARLAAYADALRAHSRGVFVEQVMGEPEAELDEAERAELEAALAAPTLCRPRAEPARGSFPLVVYHGGAGSSFEDNAALCEHLASHGYVVLGSAFPEADGSSLGVDAGRGSAEDAQFLVRWTRALSFVDWRHVALVGHSAGAQAMVRYAAQPGCAGDALVLLDTTQDYYGLALPLHESLVRDATEGVAFLTRPMLVAAGPEAMFALCDRLVNAERIYLTVPELGHDEFISQGHQRLERIARRAAHGRAGADAAEAARVQPARASYRALCDAVRSFLDAELGRGRAELEARVERERALPWSNDAMHLVRVPRGVSGPEPWDPENDVPPTPRQFRALFESEGAESACSVLERFRGREPRGPLYTSTMLSGSLLYGLVAGGKHDEAELYYAALQEIRLPVLGLFEFLSDLSTAQGKTEQALHFLRVARDLDPENAAVADELRELEEKSGM